MKKIKILVSKRKGQNVLLNNVPKEWRLYNRKHDVSHARFWFTIPLPIFEYQILNSLKEIKIAKIIDFSQKPEIVSSELLRALNL